MSTTQIANPTTTVAPIGADSAGLRMSPEEFDAIEKYDNSYCYELVDGVLVVNAIPHEAHESPNELLGYLLLDYQRRHENGASLDDTLQERFIRLTESRRRADRVIWAGLGRQPIPSKDMPSIAVEFVSVGKRDWYRDYVTKRDEYLAAGVKEYWIIDRFDRKLTVYSSSPQQLKTTEITEDQTYTTNLLPGFELPLSELLAAADKWEE